MVAINYMEELDQMNCIMVNMTKNTMTMREII